MRGTSRGVFGFGYRWAMLRVLVASLTAASAFMAVTASNSGAVPSGAVTAQGTVIDSPSGMTLGNTTPGEPTTDGDTSQWKNSVASAGNDTAQATLTDVFDSPASSPLEHVYRAGSLRTAPGFTPEWSTDAGATWTGTEPVPAGDVYAVRASGLLPPGGLPGAAFQAIPILAPVKMTAGDGWDVSFYGPNIYAIAHHNPGFIHCFVKVSSTQCPGSPYPFGQAENVFTSGTSGPAIDRNAGILWEAAYGRATQQAELYCFDLNVAAPCANRPAPIAFGPVFSAADASQVVSETVLANGKVYFLFLGPGAGNNALACWDPAKGPAGDFCDFTTNGFFTIPLAGWATSSVYRTAIWSQNGKLYLQNGHIHLDCWDPGPGLGTDQPCLEPTWPVDLDQGLSASQSFGLVPRVLPTGEDGFCAVAKNGAAYPVQCIDSAGQPVLAPANLGAMYVPDPPKDAFRSAVARGTRIYVPRPNQHTVWCFDFQLDAACAGFTTVTHPNWAAYAARVDPYHPDCIWVNSDSALIASFDAYTGAACGLEQRFQVTPQSYYCDGQAGIPRYDTLSLSGLSTGAYTSATVTITEGNGAPIPGFVNRSLTPANPTISLAAIPFGPATSSLNVLVTFAGTVQTNPSWATMPPPTLNVTWEGPPIEPLCFDTVVPPLCAARTPAGVAVVKTATLEDSTGTADLGPVTAAFDYQPGLSCGPTGTLKICKVAGPGVAVGTPFTFTVGSAQVMVPAGPTPGGSCVVVPQSFAVGESVPIDEDVPAGITVARIKVRPTERLDGPRDLAEGRANVRIGEGVTEVTYFNNRTGYLEICKAAQGEGVSGDFTFFVDPGGIGPIVVAAGTCSSAIEVASGPVVITEQTAPGTTLVACSTIPAERQVSCTGPDTPAGSGPPASTVNVVPGGISTQTIAFLTNRRTETPVEDECCTDYAGDGAPDIAVFRPSNGFWFVRGGATAAFGTTGDVPMPGDYDGNGATDITVFRPGNGFWFVQGGATVPWGTNGDIPVAADYDGDGRTDMAVFRPSIGTWFIRGGATVAWGTAGDIPLASDFDGDGRADLIVFRPSTGTWFVRASAGGGDLVFRWGTAGDIPVCCDFTGDGRADIAVYRPSVGMWFVMGQSPVAFGAPGDVPVPCDYDGDGRADIAVFRPSIGTWFIRGATGDSTAVPWGMAGDIPV